MKILLAQFPLEVHSRGLTFVANLLRDAGHEVVVLGNARPEEIAKVALDEDAEIVGISAYCGGEVVQMAALAAHLDFDVRVMIGGIFPQAHEVKLREMGFAVFPSGSDPQKILDYAGSCACQ